MISTLSLIYPVHINSNSRYILNRLQLCLTNNNGYLNQAEHVVVLSGETKYVKKATALLGELNQSNIKIINTDFSTGPYSPGTARNIGIKTSKGEYLLFWDIDLIGSPQLFNDIKTQLTKIKANPQHFCMYPCLYLTKQSSQLILKQKKTINQDSDLNQSIFSTIFNQVNSAAKNCIEHIALPTSTLLCQKAHLLKLGNFDEKFIGHKGEDLELIHRLVINNPIYGIPKDYLTDHASKNPSKQQGFRMLFSKYSAQNLTNHCYTVHLSHSTRLGSKYKNNQNNNMDYLLTKMQQSLAESKLSLNDQVINLGGESYFNQPPNIQRTKIEKFSRKIMKLIFQPKLFIRDMFNKS
ncbi:MAG: hypothetical protein HRU38_14575 [Saccharospirillaceae bacterium]|nr:hypothetical protein [Pseudomonadales bacterium]NRB79867.1 hypothetical protein [Saccharospirillaceae bacterium]